MKYFRNLKKANHYYRQAVKQERSTAFIYRSQSDHKNTLAFLVNRKTLQKYRNVNLLHNIYFHTLKLQPKTDMVLYTVKPINFKLYLRLHFSPEQVNDIYNQHKRGQSFSSYFIVPTIYQTLKLPQ